MARVGTGLNCNSRGNNADDAPQRQTDVCPDASRRIAATALPRSVSRKHIGRRALARAIDALSLKRPAMLHLRPCSPPRHSRSSFASRVPHKAQPPTTPAPNPCANASTASSLTPSTRARGSATRRASGIASPIKGGSMFMKVDAATSEKTPAFDHAALAASLSSAVGRTVTALSLPFNALVYSADERTFDVTVDTMRLTCVVADARCTRTQARRRSRRTGRWRRRRCSVRWSDSMATRRSRTLRRACRLTASSKRRSATTMCAIAICRIARLDGTVVRRL